MNQFYKYHTDLRSTRARKILLISFRSALKAIMAVALTLCGTVGMAQKTAENFIPLIKGQILNIQDASPVAFAVITNHRTKTSVSADELGIFQVKALVTDSLEISSLGFQKETVAIPAIYNVSDILTLYARPLSFLIPDINVTVKKEQMKIDQENRIVSPYFRNDMMREKPISEKVYDNQLSILKVSLGTSKKDEHRLQKAAISEKEWASVSRFYNKETVIELTGLNNTEADNLMIYINSKKLFGRMNTRENAKFTILEQFKNYKSEGHLSLLPQ